MAGFCSICKHTRREEIDTALIKNQPFRQLSPKFGVALGSLSRHKRQHLAAMLAKAEAEREESAYDTPPATLLVDRNSDSHAATPDLARLPGARLAPSASYWNDPQDARATSSLVT